MIRLLRHRRLPSAGKTSRDLRDSASISPKLHWKPWSLNEEGDWNQRNDLFEKFIRVMLEKKYDKRRSTVFIANSLGVTAGDVRVYNFSVLV